MLPWKKKKEENPPLDPEVEALSNLTVYMDTRNLIPGIVVYTVVPDNPTQEIPYTTYHTEPRIITQIHDSGVNGGTIFMTYKHYVYTDMNKKEFQIRHEEETLYSPLTQEHAEYVAKTLTEQSKALYEKFCASKQKSK